MKAQKMYRKGKLTQLRVLSSVVSPDWSKKECRSELSPSALYVPVKKSPYRAKPNEASLGNTSVSHGESPAHLPASFASMVPARPQEKTLPPSLCSAYLENGTGTTFRRATFDAPARRSPT
jgi:hypothetical protein